LAILVLIALSGLLCGPTLPAAAQTTSSFAYQGRLLTNGQPVSGSCAFQFSLYDAASAGTQLGTTLNLDAITVNDGYFKTNLDFGLTPFTGAVRYLDVSVKCASETAFTSIGRQPLAAAPQALVAQAAQTWAGLTSLPANLTFLNSPTTCTSGQVAKWIGTTWACGDITVGTDTLAKLTCTSDQVVKWNGTAWACTADTDTTYTAGTGLALTGTTFSLASVENLPIGATTPAAGKFTTLEATSLKVTGSSAPAAGSLLTADASGNATWKPKLGNIVYVAKSGGDFDTITAALNSIGTSATAANPYLIRVAPGVYTEQVTMKEFVSIEGAGEGVTIIKWTGSNTGLWDSGTCETVLGASNAELRYLTVQSDGTGVNSAMGIRNHGTSPTLSHLTISVSGGIADNIGIRSQVSGSPRMNDLTISIAAGGTNLNWGVGSDTSNPQMVNLTIDAKIGVFNDSSTSTTIRSSWIKGTTNSVVNQGAGGKLSIANTMLNGTANKIGGSFACIGVYDANFATVTCP